MIIRKWARGLFTREWKFNLLNVTSENKFAVYVTETIKREMGLIVTQKCIDVTKEIR